MTTDIDMVGITQCRQCLNGQGTEGVRYAVEVVKNRPPALIALPPTLFYRRSMPDSLLIDGVMTLPVKEKILASRPLNQSHELITIRGR